MIRKKEKGFALILSLVLLLVMSLMGGSLIVIASGDHKSNNTSDEYQQVFYVAETALIEGEKWITDNYLGHWVGHSQKHFVVAVFDSLDNQKITLYPEDANGLFRFGFEINLIIRCAEL